MAARFFTQSPELVHGLKCWPKVDVVNSNVNHQVAADPSLFVNMIAQQINHHKSCKNNSTLKSNGPLTVIRCCPLSKSPLSISNGPQYPLAIAANHNGWSSTGL